LICCVVNWIFCGVNWIFCVVLLTLNSEQIKRGFSFPTY
jgi:hypothetical protein